MIFNILKYGITGLPKAKNLCTFSLKLGDTQNFELWNEISMYCKRKWKNTLTEPSRWCRPRPPSASWRDPPGTWGSWGPPSASHLKGRDYRIISLKKTQHWGLRWWDAVEAAKSNIKICIAGIKYQNMHSLNQILKYA